MGLVRIRPRGWGLEPVLQVRHATWGNEKRTLGTGEMNTVSLSVKNLPAGVLAEGPPSSPLMWEATVEWNREAADPAAYTDNPPGGSRVEKDWWRIYIKLGI